MFERYQKYKGIHPGAVIDRELKKRNLSQRSFAIALPEHPQSFNAMIKGRRKLNTALALKIEHALGLEEGALLMLQMFYDINVEKRKESSDYHPDLSILRTNLFWDTDIHSIDWNKHDKAVIRRVFERGNPSEKEEIIRFYGSEKVRCIRQHLTGQSLF
jgi:plasmid maintenance system antidote protein VapI